MVGGISATFGEKTDSKYMALKSTPNPKKAILQSLNGFLRHHFQATCCFNFHGEQLCKAGSVAQDP